RHPRPAQTEPPPRGRRRPARRGVRRPAARVLRRPAGLSAPRPLELGRFPSPPWRGGRAVECGGLENRYRPGRAIEGSNPALSLVGPFANGRHPLVTARRPVSVGSAVSGRPDPVGSIPLSVEWLRRYVGEGAYLV